MNPSKKKLNASKQGKGPNLGLAAGLIRRVQVERRCIDLLGNQSAMEGESRVPIVTSDSWMMW